MPAEPSDVDVEGILKGIHKVADRRRRGPAGPADGLRRRLPLDPGRRADARRGLGRAADLWSVTSWNELARDGVAAEQWNLLHPGEEPPHAYLSDEAGRRAGTGRRGLRLHACRAASSRAGCPATTASSAPTASASPTPGRPPVASSTSTPSVVVVQALQALADAGEVPVEKVVRRPFAALQDRRPDRDRGHRAGGRRRVVVAPDAVGDAASWESHYERRRTTVVPCLRPDAAPRKRCATPRVRSARPRRAGCRATCRGSTTSAPSTGPGSGSIAPGRLQRLRRLVRPRVEASAHDPLAVVRSSAPPRASFAGVITLQQTVAMIRLSIRSRRPTIDAAPRPRGRRARCATRSSATAASSRSRPPPSTPTPPRSRGAWDARLEALVVDSVMRGDADETIRTRVPAPWAGARTGTSPWSSAPCPRSRAELDASRRRTPRGARRRPRRARRHPGRPARRRASAGCPTREGGHPVARPHFGDGPVVVGPVVRRPRPRHASARAALSAHRAASGWPDAPRPGRRADDLLPERALAGDGHRQAAPRRRGLPAAAGHARRPPGHAHGVARPRRLDRGHGPRPLRPPQHGALPAAPDLRR